MRLGTVSEKWMRTWRSLRSIWQNLGSYGRILGPLWRGSRQCIQSSYPPCPKPFPPILVHADSTPGFTITVGINRLLELLTTPMIDWDNSPMRPATLDWRVMKSMISAIDSTSTSYNEPLIFASCGRPATLTNTCILVDQILASSFLGTLWPRYHSTRYRHVLS